MKQEKLVPYNLRLPEDLKKKVTLTAKKEKRSLNKQIILVLENYLSEKNIPKTA